MPSSIIKVSANRSIIVVPKQVTGTVGRLSAYTVGQLAQFTVQQLGNL